nr:hypothetical protein [bacterium]
VVCGYNGDSGDYCLSVDPILPCDEQCPPGAVLEGEPECGNGYDDQYNSGCGGEPPVFSQLPVEEILCATSGTFLYQGDATRDTDWYQFDLTDLTAVTVSLYPEFPANIMLIAANSGNCYDYDILEFASGERCQHTLVQGSLPAGLYWVWVAPTEFWGVDCGTPYILNLNTVGLPPIDNLQIQCQEEQLLLYWSPITGATIYHIYAGSTPYGDFEWVDSTTEALWGTTNSREQQFFQVTYEME